MKRVNYSILSLCFILICSTARSFQPQQTSSSSATTIHKDNRANTSLKVSTAISTGGGAAGPRGNNVFQDWANTLGAPSANNNNKRRKRLSSSSKKSSRTTSSVSTTSPRDLHYERAKEEWANRYTNLDSLRSTFGANRNKLWGDLDAPTARRLYKTLLPKALLELVKVDGIQPEDLAPLAYQARVAAKLYARERCQVPFRVFCQLFDGYRQFKKYGKFQTSGMSYDQIFEKYHDQLMLEEAQHQLLQQEDVEPYEVDEHGLTEQDVTAKICLKILERSCVSNENVDRWVLPPPNTQEEREDLMKITQTLENDVRKLLDPTSQYQKNTPLSVISLRKYRTLRLIAKAKQRRRRNSHHSSSTSSHHMTSNSNQHEDNTRNNNRQ